jgi:RND superfamily putative drug exporter
VNRGRTIASVGAPLVNPAQDAAVISAVPRNARAAPDTTALVKSIRSLAASLDQSDGVRVYVTGTTALNVDVSNKLTSALPLYLVDVIGLALLLLRLGFRSVLVPVKAALGFLLTIGSTSGRWSPCSSGAGWPTCSGCRRPARSSASCRSF